MPTLPATLPEHATSFVGRSGEVGAVEALLDEHAIVTVAGPGGAGKTRLCVEVAGAVAASYPGGTAFVDLAAVDEPLLVDEAVVHALGGGASGSLREVAAQTAETGRALVVLDNCEHVREAAARAAEQLAGVVSVLATTREPLRVPGEFVWRIPPLATPDSAASADEVVSHDAVRLFAERAAAVRPGFAIDYANATAAAELCRLLDGSPLAIELAAGRIRVLSIEQILERITGSLRLLSADRTPDRHSSLQTTIAWSYDLLDAATQRVFRVLGVFAGTFGLEAALAVAGPALADEQDAIDRLSDLYDRSLLTVRERGGTARYRLLDMLRTFARDRLNEAGEWDEVSARLSAWAVALAEAAEAELAGPSASAALDRLALDHDNLRSALAWSLSRDDHHADGVRLCAALWRFWHVRGHLTEGRLWLLRAVGEPGAPTSERARALNGAGALAGEQGDYEQAAKWYDEALAILRAAGDLRGAAAVLNNRGTVAYHLGDLEAAAAHYEESQRAFETSGDEASAASALINVGSVAYVRGDTAGARASWERALNGFRGLGLQDAAGHALNNLGMVAHAEARADEARACWEQALDIFTSLQNPQGRGHVLINLATLDRRPDSRRASAALTESLDALTPLGDRRGTTAWLDAAAGVLVAAGRAEIAAEASGAADALRRAIGAGRDPAEEAAVAVVAAELVEALGDAASSRRAAGSHAPVDAVIARCRDALADLAGASAPPPGDSAPSQPEETAASLGAARVVRLTVEGEWVQIDFDGRSARLRRTLGLEYLAHLTARPGSAVHCLELVGSAGGVDAASRGRRSAPSADGLSPASDGDAGPVLDEAAKAAYRRRLQDLEEEIAEATQWSDDERAARAKAELEAVAEELARAVGLHGRDRKTGSPVERARVNVTRAIKTALERLARADAGAAHHLSERVKTGTFCFYEAREAAEPEPEPAGGFT